MTEVLLLVVIVLLLGLVTLFLQKGQIKTDSHKVALIKAGVHAKKLSDQAREVRDDIAALSRRFCAVDRQWRILYGIHLKNAINKADDLDRAYGSLREEFDRVSKLYDHQS